MLQWKADCEEYLEAHDADFQRRCNDQQFADLFLAGIIKLDRLNQAWHMQSEPGPRPRLYGAFEDKPPVSKVIQECIKLDLIELVENPKKRSEVILSQVPIMFSRGGDVWRWRVCQRNRGGASPSQRPPCPDPEGEPANADGRLASAAASAALTARDRGAQLPAQPLRARRTRRTAARRQPTWISQPARVDRHRAPGGAEEGRLSTVDCAAVDAGDPRPRHHSRLRVRPDAQR